MTACLAAWLDMAEGFTEDAHNMGVFNGNVK